MLDGRVLGASQVEYKPFRKPPLKREVERLLDEAGQRAQEVERGAAQAVEETAAVAAEEGEVAVDAEGVGGAFGYLGGLAEGWAWALQAAQPTASRAAGCWRTRVSGPRSSRARGGAGLPPAGQRERGRAASVRQQHDTKAGCTGVPDGFPLFRAGFLHSFSSDIR